jgi:hypothetical protein
MDVLEYAVKHEYMIIADEAAVSTIGFKTTHAAKILSFQTFKAWVCLFSTVLSNGTDCTGT